MKRAAREQNLVMPKHIHVRKVCGENTVIFGCRRAQQQRAGIANKKGKLGQKSRAFKEDALFAEAT